VKIGRKIKKMIFGREFEKVGFFDKRNVRKKDN
jgi:hypothetical protein